MLLCIPRAPPGTEVEELTYKQIVKALRYKTPTEQYLSTRGMNMELKDYKERPDRPTGKEKTSETQEEKEQKKEEIQAVSHESRHHQKDDEEYERKKESACAL